MIETTDNVNPTNDRWALSSIAVTLLLSLWFVVLCNSPFWGAVLQVQGGLSASNMAFTGSLFLLVTILINILLTLIAWPWVGRVLIGIVLVISSIVTYFTSAYGVMIDRVMIRNVFETDMSEAFELINPSLLLYLLLLGVLPLLLLIRVRIEFASWRRELTRKALVMLASGVAIAAIAFSFNEDYAALLRNHRELRQMLTPLNYFAALQGYAKEMDRASGPREIVGGDAVRSSSWPVSKRKTLLVIVLGETARTANFSLGGYARPTNPELAGKNVVFYRNVESCGTSTSVSLPCMFSGLDRDHFSEKAAAKRESLLKLVARAGLAVLWRENNSGCKGTCEGVETEILSTKQISGLCRDGECWDEVLLEGLQERLDREKRDLVIVLHQKGSHGPAYYLRYPDRFAVFQPACQTSDLGSCSQEEITNAYDNSILYTDHVLTRIIGLLENNSKRFDSSMIYVSDHGESLGEKGLYLHGIPFLLAPEEQKKVPMVFWASAGFRRRLGLKKGCLEANADVPYSHDHFYHSVLGLLRIETAVYRPELDVFRPCISASQP